MSYVYPQAADLKDQPVVGSHQCVALVQEYAGAPTTPHWRQGESVVGNTMLKPGTAIATFFHGRYPSHRHGNHAALYVRQGIGGIYIADQWWIDLGGWNKRGYLILDTDSPSKRLRWGREGES